MQASFFKSVDAGRGKRILPTQKISGGGFFRACGLRYSHEFQAQQPYHRRRPSGRFHFPGIEPDDFLRHVSVLATGPASRYTDFGAIASAPIRKGSLTPVDTWAGRGGFGSKLFQEHGIVGIIYGGTYVDEDFRERKVADQWFADRYNQRMAAKDLEATTKYRYDPGLETGGTFGVNYAAMSGNILAFNYRTIYWPDSRRRELHQRFILDHYLKQFNEETIRKKQQKTCGEPCAAVCKKMNGSFKKDYEPYQAMGPLCGIFDQRAAEKLAGHADVLGVDAIAAGGILSWLMDCLDEKLLDPDHLGVAMKPKWNFQDFDVVEDSMHNAELGMLLLDEMVRPKGKLPLGKGARKLARALGKENAHRMLQELMLDNLGLCRFHRAWAEELMPDIVEKIYGLKDRFLASIRLTAGRITSRNASVFWESERNIDMVHTFLKNKKEVDEIQDPDLDYWLGLFEKNKYHAAYEFWYEMHKGTHEILREFPV